MLLPMGSQRVGHDLGIEEQQQAFEMNRGGWQIVTLVVKSPPAKPGHVRDADLIPELGRSARVWQPAPVFLLEESHGQRSLEGYSP